MTRVLPMNATLTWCPAPCQPFPRPWTKRPLLILGIIPAFTVLIFQFAHLYFKPSSQIKTQNNKSAENEEITQIKGTTDLGQQAKLYTKLIQRVGPEQAQEALYKSGLPFD